MIFARTNNTKYPSLVIDIFKTLFMMFVKSIKLIYVQDKKITFIKLKLNL
jgi:hypothetical protein